jgi:hypothetical protein
MSDINLSNVVIAVYLLASVAVATPAILFAAVGGLYARFAHQGRHRARWLRASLRGGAVGFAFGLALVLSFFLSLG